MIGLTRGVAFGATLNGFVEVFGQYDNDEDGSKNDSVEHRSKKATGGKNPRLRICSGRAHIAFACNGFDWFLSRVGDELVYTALKGSNVLLEIVEFFDEVIEIEPDGVRLPQTH